jgi:hypothetical protein
MRLAQQRPPGADRTPDPIEQRVAIDRESYRPLLVRALHGRISYRVAEIGSVSRASADFSKPTPVSVPPRQQISSGSVVSSTEIGLDAARVVLDRPGLWAGQRIAGLQLTSVTHRVLRTAYARSTGLDPRDADGLSLEYGSGAEALRIDESTGPSFAYGWVRGSRYPVPPEGSVRIGPLDLGWIVRNGVYVRIMSTLGEDSVLAAARALEEIPG